VVTGTIIIFNRLDLVIILRRSGGRRVSVAMGFTTKDASIEVSCVFLGDTNVRVSRMTPYTTSVYIDLMTCGHGRTIPHTFEQIIVGGIRVGNISMTHTSSN